jgi:glycosyltransferase involved in cell wall biosynthesis
MRVGLDVGSLSPYLTGIGRYTWELCRGLARHDAVADMAYYRHSCWISHPERFLSVESAATAKPLVRMPRRIRQWRFRRNARNRVMHGPNFFLPDHVEHGVITVHDLSVARYPDCHPAERVRMFERDFEKSLRRARHIIVDSNAIKLEMMNRYKLNDDDITVVYLGISSGYEIIHARDRDLLLQNKYGLETGSYILSVATLEPRKRIEAAIVAHSTMCERLGLNVPLVLVGASGWHNDQLLALIDRAQAIGRLKFLGYVPEPDLPAIYGGARLFLYPSIYEGFGLPPVEAMACGVPAIVSNRSCLPEVTGGAAMLIDPDDIDGFSRAIEQGLSDDIWRAEAIEAGVRIAARYTWQRCIEETMDVYQKVMGSNS